MTQPLTDAITALTRYANETTGQSDTNLSDAVRTLCDGYGGGGYSIDDYLNHQMAGSVTYTGASISGITLQGQKDITELNFPNVGTFASVSGSAFSGITSLTSFSAPKATRIAMSMLSENPALTSVDFSSLTDTGTNLFLNCSALSVLVLPQVQTIYSQTFRGCSNLQKLDVLATRGFTNQNNMNGCAKLTELIIRNTSVSTLSNINNFTGTPFASNGTGGTLYVPQDLISSYQSASNWSTILGYANNQILPIEGSIYETQYADGTPIE